MDAIKRSEENQKQLEKIKLSQKSSVCAVSCCVSWNRQKSDSDLSHSCIHGLSSLIIIIHTHTHQAFRRALPVPTHINTAITRAATNEITDEQLVRSLTRHPRYIHSSSFLYLQGDELIKAEMLEMIRFDKELDTINVFELFDDLDLTNAKVWFQNGVVKCCTFLSSIIKSLLCFFRHPIIWALR